MKTPFILLAVLLIYLQLTITPALSQTKVKFGKVSKQELEMKVYEKDTSAIAVVLYDNGHSYFKTEFRSGSSTFLCIFERHVRIKILKPEGFNYANFEIPIYTSNGVDEKITEIKAKTFSLNEKITTDKLNQKSIYSEKTSPNWKTVKFAMPNIQVGSVIDCKYTIASPYYHNFRSWQFQYNIPVVYSQYQTSIPEYFHYQKTIKGHFNINTIYEGSKSESFIYKYTEMDKNPGSSKLIEHEFVLTPSSTIYKYIAENIPAFKSESYMLTLENYLSGIEFELQSYKIENGKLHEFTTNWNSVCKRLIKHSNFGEIIKGNSFLDKIIPDLINNCESKQEKIACIYRAVQNNIRFNKENRLFCDKNLKAVWKEKSGNSAEINMLLIAMLRKAGVNANPIVLSTRQNGIIHPSHPSITELNYVVACADIDSQKYVLDATDPYLPIGLLPFRCLNGKGRLISDTHSEWVNLNPQKGSKISMKANIKLDDKGTIKGQIKEGFYDYEAINFRKKIINNIDNYTKKLKADYEDWNIDSVEYDNINNRSKPLLVNYQINTENSANKQGELIYLNPIIKYQTNKNPFKLEERNYPVDFGHPISINYLLALEIPKNYSLEEKPSSALIKLPNQGGSYLYRISQSGNKIIINLKFNIKQTQFISSEYEILKEFYNQVITTEKQMLVFKKNSYIAEQ